jgi:hypothetical protein
MLFRFASAPNSAFSQGLIVNVFHAGAQRLFALAQSLSQIAKLPMMCGFSIIYCFVILGFTWLSGIAIFVLAIGTNLYIARISARY